MFVEAAATGVAQVAGPAAPPKRCATARRLVVDHPEDLEAVAIALARLLDDPAWCCRPRARRRGDESPTTAWRPASSRPAVPGIIVPCPVAV